MGLAWNPLGGSPVYVETAALPTQLNESGGGVNSVTGQLGAVMKESVNIAYTFARKFVQERYVRIVLHFLFLLQYVYQYATNRYVIGTLKTCSSRATPCIFMSLKEVRR